MLAAPGQQQDHSWRLLLHQRQVDSVGAAEDSLGQVAARVHVVADRICAGGVGAGGCPPPVAGGGLLHGLVVEQGRGAIADVELPVTLVAPTEFSSLNRPPPLIVAQLFRMQLPVTVVLPVWL